MIAMVDSFPKISKKVVTPNSTDKQMWQEMPMKSKLSKSVLPPLPNTTDNGYAIRLHTEVKKVGGDDE